MACVRTGCRRRKRSASCSSSVLKRFRYIVVVHARFSRVGIAGDGLRADFVFSANASAIVPDAPERVAPYLRVIVEVRAWLCVLFGDVG